MVKEVRTKCEQFTIITQKVSNEFMLYNDYLRWINEAINEFSVALKKDNSSLIHQWKNKLQWIKDTHL